MKPMSKRKLAARKRYWEMVQSVQDELSAAVIHDREHLNNVAEEAQLADATVRRFFHFGGAKGYSWLHGPYATTIFGIADAIGFDVKITRRK